MYIQTERTFTLDEYLEKQSLSEVKLEFHNGRIYALAGVSHAHNVIRADLYECLQEQLPNRCEIYDCDTAIAIPKDNMYLYPDIALSCLAPAGFRDKPLSAIDHPEVIIEVLSPNTMTYDRSEKFQFYRAIPSLKSYILIHSEKAAIDTFYQERPGLWRIASVYALNDRLPEQVLSVDLTLADIYKRVSYIG